MFYQCKRSMAGQSEDATSVIFPWSLFICVGADVDILVKDNLSWEIFKENTGISEYFACLSGICTEQSNLCTESILAKNPAPTEFHR